MNAIPDVFWQLLSNEYISENEIVHTQDGFWMICRSLAEILARKNIFRFTDEDGIQLACDKFFDDWFLYGLCGERGCVYSLLKLREQEHDAEGDSPADGDTPGVTISFISFDPEVLLCCLERPTNENVQRLSCEIDRVVAERGQRHDNRLKLYFIDPGAEASYLVADLYVKHVASFAQNGVLEVPDHYKEIAKNKKSRLPRFVESVNQADRFAVCDHEKIYIQDADKLTEHEYVVILATHTGNTSRYSFAAEVEYHAKYLTSLARIRLPLLKKSIYDSAIRADMTVGDAERWMFAPYYRENSQIVKKQYKLHK